MRNKPLRRPRPWPWLLENARYEVLPTATAEEKVLTHVPRRTGRSRSPPRPARGSRRRSTSPSGSPARVHRRAAPRRADDHGPLRAGRDRDRLTGKGIDGSSCRAGTRTRRRLPRRALAARGPHRAGPAVRARRHHRLPGVAPDDQRRPDRAGDVGQAPPRHPRGQQPDLRPGRRRPGSGGCATAGSRCRCCSGSPGRSSAPSCCHGHQDRGRRVRPGSWPSTRGRSRGSPRPVASPASGSSRCAPALAMPDALVEGLHVFTFNQIAETEAWRGSRERLRG